MGLLAQGRPVEAREHLEAMAHIAPHDSEIQYNLGIFLLQNGELKEAVNHFNAALAERPDFPEARKRLKEIFATHPGLTNSAALDSQH
jgi:tetratricopeptide (TPR) repeat protein